MAGSGQGEREAGAAATDAGADSPIPMALWAGRWLPYSQTFIYEQLLAERRYQSTVFCHMYSGDHE